MLLVEYHDCLEKGRQCMLCTNKQTHNFFPILNILHSSFFPILMDSLPKKLAKPTWSSVLKYFSIRRMNCKPLPPSPPRPATNLSTNLLLHPHLHLIKLSRLNQPPSRLRTKSAHCPFLIESMLAGKRL